MVAAITERTDITNIIDLEIPEDNCILIFVCFSWLEQFQFPFLIFGRFLVVSIHILYV